MPTYEYACEKCGRTFDYFQSMNDARLTTCIFEDCDGAVRRKLGTGAGIIFKGSGFYQTDYRSDSYKKGKDSDSKTSAEPAAAGSKADAVPSGTGSASNTSGGGAGKPAGGAPSKGD